jgi:hypothetical protein
MQPPPYGSYPQYGLPQHGGLRPLGVGEIVDNAIQVYRKNFRALVTMTAVAVVPIQVVIVLVNLSARHSRTTGPSESIGGIRFGSTATDGHDAAVRLGASLVVIVLGLIAGRLAIGACTRGVADAYLGGAKADAGTSLRFALRSLGSMIWLEFLVIGGIIVGFVCCIVPGVWLGVSWLVATPVLLVEGLRGTEAMRRSFRLVKPRWGPTFGLALVAALLAGVVSFSLNLVLVAVIFSTRDTTSTAYIVIAGVLGTISSLITTPFVAAAYVILYFDLRVRGEGLDLQLVLNGLDSQVTPNIASPNVASPWATSPWAGGAYSGPPPPPPPAPPPPPPPPPPLNPPPPAPPP